MGGGADGVDSGTDASVRAAEHGATQLDGAEAGVGKMLCGGGGFLEPAVVGEVHDDLRAGAREFPCQARDGVLEADGGNDTDLFPLQLVGQRIERGASGERTVVFGTRLLLVDFLQQRDGLHERDGFTKDDEVALAVGYEIALGVLDCDGVVDLCFFFLVKSVRARFALDLDHAVEKVESTAFSDAADGVEVFTPRSPLAVVRADNASCQCRLRP